MASRTEIRPEQRDRQLEEELGRQLRYFLERHPEELGHDEHFGGAKLRALLVAQRLGDRRPDRASTAVVEEIVRHFSSGDGEEASEGFSAAEVKRSLRHLALVGHHVPAEPRRQHWRVRPDEDAVGLVSTRFAYRLIVTGDRHHDGGPVAVRDKLGEYRCEVTPRWTAFRVLAALGAIRARLGYTGTTGRDLWLSEQLLGEWVWGRGTPIGSEERAGLRRALRELQVPVHASVDAHRDGYSNAAKYAIDFAALAGVEWRCADGEWRDEQAAQAFDGLDRRRREEAGERVSSPRAALGSGPTLRIRLSEPYEADLDDSKGGRRTFLDFETLRHTPALEGRLYVLEQASLAPATNPTHRPDRQGYPRRQGFYDGPQMLSTLGIRDQNVLRRRRRLKAGVSYLAEMSEAYSAPMWRPRERSERHGYQLYDFAAVVDPRQGRRLRAHLRGRRPQCVAERMCSRALDPDELHPMRSERRAGAPKQSTAPRGREPSQNGSRARPRPRAP